MGDGACHMFRLNRHGDDTVPLHLQNTRLYKGDSSVQETQETSVETVTFDDSSSLVIDAPESKQTGVIKLSNVDAGAQVNLSVTNTGLTGAEIQDLIEPAADTLTSISSDIARSSSATAAVSASISDAVDGAGAVFKTIGDTVGDVFNSIKNTLKEPGVQLAAAGGVLLLLASRRKK